MELKDVILSTLAEMEDDNTQNTTTNTTVKSDSFNVVPRQEATPLIKREIEEPQGTSIDNELMFLQSVRERLLVIFEGFQAPNNSNIEAKVDMTLNFLEYTLATIDLRVEKLEKGDR